MSTETGLTASSRKSPPDTGSCASRRHQRQRALCRHARASAAQLPAGDPRSVAVRDRPADPRPAVAAALANAIALLQREALSGRLWIVEAGRVRIHD